MSRAGKAVFSVLVLVGATFVGAAGAGAHADPQYPPPVLERFQKIALDTDLTQPMRIAVAGDGRVVLIERDGRVKVWDPRTQGTTVAGTVPVRVTGELGLVGLALAPDFATTGHLYLHFSPPEWDKTFVSRVARFTLTPDNVLDLASETRVLDIQHPAGVVGWHSAGDLLMTPDGQLFIATGDNSDCCASNGFPPTDERPGQAGGDAQRTAANTNDLNGKILRITPRPDGGYDIPPGNLFPPGTDKTRPEIYAMGFRNPFTLGDWDPATKSLWMADYGPDAVLADPRRGPAGHVRALLIKEPGNYGWPYCTMNNVPYNDWNYVTNAPGPWFDCAAPVNDSPNNTGLVTLPPIKPADIYYTYDRQPDSVQDLYGGGAMAGPRYTYDENNPSPTKFPRWFDQQRFLYDWTADWIRTLPFDAGSPGQTTEFMPGTPFHKPMDLEFGPDGSLYVLEYGNGWEPGNDDSGLYRIDYVAANRAPAVVARSTVDSGPLPLTVGFDAAGTTDPDGDALAYSWDFTGDGVADATGPAASWTFTEPGEHTARVTVTDAQGATSVGNVAVTAGNTRPTVRLEWPPDGGWSEFGTPMPFRVKVTDPEDGVVDCTKVVVTYQLGHNQHGHPQGEARPGPDCTGVLTPAPDAGHGEDTYVFHILDASYTDGGAPGAPALTGSTDLVLHPREYQGRDYQSGSGVGLYFGQLFVPDRGDWFSFPRINLAGVDHLSMEFSTRQAGVRLTVHADSPTGPVVAAFPDVPHTGSTSLNDRVYQWRAADVTDPGGVHDLYFVADWPQGVQPELFVRFFRFQQASELAAAVAPASSPSGWHTSDVTVSVTAAPLWDRQVSVDGGPWTPAPAVVSADGVHEVRYRAVDVAGRSESGVTTVRLDKTAPSVAVGAVRGHSGVLAVPVTETGSGLSETTAELDGEPVTTPLELWRYPVGPHELTVTATDVAGNTTTSTTDVTITTSLAELTPLIDRFDVPFVKEVVMRLQLMGAERAMRQGHLYEALMWLYHFRTTASRLRDDDARTTLRADATLVINQLSAGR
jgi:glucose/arabinose dehydrogenase